MVEMVRALAVETKWGFNFNSCTYFRFLLQNIVKTVVNNVENDSRTVYILFKYSKCFFY